VQDSSTAEHGPRSVPSLIELGLIDEISGRARTELDTDLHPLVQRAVAVTGMRHGAVNLLDGTHLHSVAAHGFPGGRVTRDGTICAEVTGRAPDVYAFSDLRTEPGFIDNPYVDGRLTRIRAYASAPIVVADSVVGVLCVADEQSRTLTLQQCDELAQLATDAALRLADASPSPGHRPGPA
jgi:GAF domain-containing protein